MKSKRLISGVALLTAIGLSVGGCAPNSNDTETVDINIFQFKVEINDQLKQAIDDYKDVNPNVKINLETVGGGDDYGAVLSAKFDKSTTIYNIGGPQDVQDWQGKLEDLSDQPWVDQAVDGVLGAVTSNGKVYGLPYSIEGYGLIYNKEIFEAAGIDGSTLDSYAKIEHAFQTLQQKIDQGELKDKYPQLKAVVELPAYETWITGLHGTNIALNQEFDSAIDAFESKTVAFKHADALKKYFDLQANFTEHASNQSKLNAIKYSDQVEGGIAIERVAVIQQGNWVYNDVKQLDPQVAAKLGILPIPLEGIKEDSIPVGVPMYWAINAEAEENQKKEAKEFLNWLYQSEQGKKIVVNEFGFIPAFKNYTGLEPGDVLGQAVKRFTEAGKISNWVFMGYPSDWGMGIFGTKLQAYFAGSKSFDEVVQESKDEWAKQR